MYMLTMKIADWTALNWIADGFCWPKPHEPRERDMHADCVHTNSSRFDVMGCISPKADRYKSCSHECTTPIYLFHRIVIAASDASGGSLSLSLCVCTFRSTLRFSTIEFGLSWNINPFAFNPNQCKHHASHEHHSVSRCQTSEQSVGIFRIWKSSKR